MGVGGLGFGVWGSGRGVYGWGLGVGDGFVRLEVLGWKILVWGLGVVLGLRGLKFWTLH